MNPPKDFETWNAASKKLAEIANKVEGDFWDYHTWRGPDQLETLKNSIQELREALLSAGYTEGDE